MTLKLEWADFSGIDNSTTASFNLTERQQIFLLTLLASAVDKYQWLEPTDADFDLAEAFMSELTTILQDAF